MQLVEPSNKALRTILEDAEYAATYQSDFVDHDEADPEAEEEPTGSNSDSDFDISKKNGGV